MSETRTFSEIRTMNSENIKLIGKGYWYNVYDLGNGRVLKHEKGILQKIKDTYLLEGKKVIPWLTALYKLLTGRKKILKIYSYIKNNVDLTLVGSPKFLDGISYEQDKVELLGVAIMRSVFNEKKRLIDLYVQNIIQCWKNGFADRIYNFAINNGINNSRRLVLLDFNEITLLREEVLERIKSKRWLRSWSLKQVDSELQQYYREQMDLLITSESLEKNWMQKQKVT